MAVLRFIQGVRRIGLGMRRILHLACDGVTLFIADRRENFYFHPDDPSKTYMRNTPVRVEYHPPYGFLVYEVTFPGARIGYADRTLPRKEMKGAAGH